MTNVNTTDQTATSAIKVDSPTDVRGDVTRERTGRGTESSPVSGSLRVSRFDIVTSFLMAVILLVGTFVSMLMVVWMLGAESRYEKRNPPLVRFAASHRPRGFERDFLEPREDEVEQLQDVSVQDVLLAVTDVATRVAGGWVVSDSDPLTAAARRPQQGDSRPPGEWSENVSLARCERWQLNFSATDRDSYAGQLDFYKIELGAIGGSISGVDYAHDLSSRPQSRRGDSELEKRLYFLWNQPGPLMRFDQQLLAMAGIELEGRQLLKFVPCELENRLARIELEYARSHGHPAISEIAKTVFQSEKVTDGYRFTVVGQRYRRPQS